MTSNTPSCLDNVISTGAKEHLVWVQLIGCNQAVRLRDVEQDRPVCPRSSRNWLLPGLRGSRVGHQRHAHRQSGSVQELIYFSALISLFLSAGGDPASLSRTHLHRCSSVTCILLFHFVLIINESFQLKCQTSTWRFSVLFQNPLNIFGSVSPQLWEIVIFTFWYSMSELLLKLKQFVGSSIN